jgi:hypothetical protein
MHEVWFMSLTQDVLLPLPLPLPLPSQTVTTAARNAVHRVIQGVSAAG